MPGPALQSHVGLAATFFFLAALYVAAYVRCVVAGWVDSEVSGSFSVLLGALSPFSATAVEVAAYAGCVAAAGWVGSGASDNGLVLLGALSLFSTTAVEVAAYAGCVVAAGWVGSGASDNGLVLLGALSPFSTTAVEVAAYAGCVVAIGWVGSGASDNGFVSLGTPSLEQFHVLSGPALQSQAGLAPQAFEISSRALRIVGKTFVFPDTL